MPWRIEFSAEADRELRKLDPQHAKRILKFLQERVAKLDDPRTIGKALQGSRLGEFWRYRVGPFRIICKSEDALLLVLVLRIGDRKEIYRCIANNPPAKWDVFARAATGSCFPIAANC